MALARDDVANVVQIGGDRRDLAATRVVAERFQNETRAVRGGVRVPLAVLGVPDRAGLLVRRADVGLHLRVGLHRVEGRSLVFWLRGSTRFGDSGVDHLQLLLRAGVL